MGKIQFVVGEYIRFSYFGSDNPCGADVFFYGSVADKKPRVLPIFPKNSFTFFSDMI